MGEPHGTTSLGASAKDSLWVRVFAGRMMPFVAPYQQRQNLKTKHFGEIRYVAREIFIYLFVIINSSKFRLESKVVGIFSAETLINLHCT